MVNLHLKEQKKREAQRRQAEIMARFQSQQKLFMQQMADDDEEEEGQDVTMEHSESAKDDTATSTEQAYECCLCRTAMLPLADPHHQPMGLISLVQRTNVVATAQAQALCVKWWESAGFNVEYEYDFNDSEEFDMNIQWRKYRSFVHDMYHRLRRSDNVHLHTQSCGHCMHVNCFTRYLKIFKRSTTNIEQVDITNRS